MRKPYIVASLLGASSIALLSLVSFPACSCLSVAQATVAVRWLDMDPEVLTSGLEKRYPRGLSEAELRSRIDGYATYCQASAAGIHCTYPHERTLLRKTAANLTVGLDAERRANGVRVERADRYFWQSSR